MSVESYVSLSDMITFIESKIGRADLKGEIAKRRHDENQSIIKRSGVVISEIYAELKASDVETKSG